MAEDDPLMSRMYERAFAASGHELITSSDGKKALADLRAMEEKPLVIILDVMMPLMSGFDVLRAIKEDDHLKNVPVILLTNLAGEKDAEKGLSLGAVLYLIKSQYDPKQIVDKVKEIISSYSREEGVPEVKVQLKEISDKE